ncbi:hypothetical protein HYQ44_014927 [Verticillium longisporum]|nr:hypothetical protein HYQ44_014927 [Verticillium longisporum]
MAALSKIVPSVAELDRIPERVIRLLRLSIYGGAAFAAYKIHYIIDSSELLPAHPKGPEGWRGGPNGVGDEEDLGEVANDGSWDWKMVEKRRREGMVFAQQFANLDTLESWFDGGDGGDGSALGRFGLSAASW